MSDRLASGRGQGWVNLVARAASGAQRRVRDHAFAKRLQSPGFRAGGSPRVLGLSHMTVGPDFRAGDALWLEAVVRYGEGAARRSFEPRLTIGAHARLSDNVHIACLESVTIGEHLLCGSRVLITDHAHGVYGGSGEGSDPAIPPAERPLHSPGAVRIGANVWLSEGVAVLPGAVIGDGCVVGANSVVRGELPPGVLAVGTPARPVRRWDAGSGRWLAISD